MSKTISNVLKPLAFMLAMSMAVGFAQAQQGGPGGGGGPGGPGGAGGPAGRSAGPGDSGDGAGGRRPLLARPSTRSAPGEAEFPPASSEEQDTRPAGSDFGGSAPAPTLPDLRLPGLSNYAPAAPHAPLANGDLGEIVLHAQLTEDSADIPRGLVWRVFRPDPDESGKLPLVASAEGGTSTFQLEPGSYLVHAAYGRAGATKRITVTRDTKRESLVLDAGGLKLDAVQDGDARVPAEKLRFSIFDSHTDATGERALIIPDVSPGTIVRLNAGTYHVVSTYGAVNAIVRADIRVESGQVTEAIVEHKAAQLTLKLVREEGGEAIADTAWSVLNAGGDIVQENVGAFASMVLSEGNYTVIAKNRDRVYSRDFAVVAGHDQDVDVLAVEGQPVNPGESSGDE